MPNGSYGVQSLYFKNALYNKLYFETQSYFESYVISIPSNEESITTNLVILANNELKDK